MKTFLIAFMTLSLLAAVAQKKGGPAATSAQSSKHADQVKTYSGSDLNWGSRTNRVTCRRKTGCAGRKSDAERAIHYEIANACWIQDPASPSPRP